MRDFASHLSSLHLLQIHAKSTAFVGGRKLGGHWSEFWLVRILNLTLYHGEEEGGGEDHHGEEEGGDEYYHGEEEGGGEDYNEEEGGGEQYDEEHEYDEEEGGDDGEEN